MVILRNSKISISIFESFFNPFHQGIQKHMIVWSVRFNTAIVFITHVRIMLSLILFGGRSHDTSNMMIDDQALKY